MRDKSQASHQEAVIGIDLGQSWIRGHVFLIGHGSQIAWSQQEQSNVLRTRTPFGSTAGIIAACAEVAKTAIDLATSPVVAVGIGSFGVVDMRSGTVLECGYPWWSNVDLAARISAQVRHPVSVLNDIAAEALGIARGAILPPSSLFAVVKVGTNVGVGADPRHLPILAQHASFGQVSRLPALSGAAFSSLGGKALGEVARSVLHADASAVDLFMEASAGHGSAVRIIDGWVQDLAGLLAVVSRLLVPDVIFLCGSVFESASSLYEQICDAYARLTPRSAHVPAFEFSVNERVACYGAACWALDARQITINR